MEDADTRTNVRNERLASIVEQCLGSQAAYKLFDMLSAISEVFFIDLRFLVKSLTSFLFKLDNFSNFLIRLAANVLLS